MLSPPFQLMFEKEIVEVQAEAEYIIREKKVSQPGNRVVGYVAEILSSSHSLLLLAASTLRC